MEYREQFKNLDYTIATKFLSEQTLNFGNKTVISSGFLILISLNFLNIKELEVEGITVEIDLVILTLVIALVNFYYYQQFRLSRKVDLKSFILPKGFTVMKNQVNYLNEEADKVSGEHKDLAKKIRQNINDGVYNEENIQEAFEELDKLSKEIIELEKTVSTSVMSMKPDLPKVKEFNQAANQYNLLNGKIPEIIYYLGLLCVIFRFTLDVVFICNTQEKPLEHIFQREIKYVNQIISSTKR